MNTKLLKTLIIDHQFYHKWAVISAEDFAGGPKGYLKVDISITTIGNVPKIPLIIPEDTDVIEGFDLFYFLLFLFFNILFFIMNYVCLMNEGSNIFFWSFLVIYCYRKA